MQDIQELAMQTYKENMEYFEQKNETLHNKLLALETILNNGSIEQKYDLEYKVDYFDVVELKSGNFLYNTNSNDYSQTLLDSVTYKKDDQVFETQRNYNFDKTVVDYLKDEDDIYANFSTSAQIIKYHNDYIDKSQEMIYLDKYIFFGTGLGLHIEKIVKKFDLQVVLIIEKDIELFRLSMFTCNYKDLLSGCDAFFSIAQNRNEFHSTFNNFYIKAFIKNHYFKFSVFSSAYEDSIKEIQSLLITRPEATYSHERLLVKNKKVVAKLEEKYKFLNTSKKLNETFFQNKPFLVIGAGPSLHKNEEWIKKHHQEFVIIAVFAALKTLKRFGISPDIVAQIDENETTNQGMIDNLGDIDFLKNALFMYSASVPQSLFDLVDKQKVYLHEDRTMYKNSYSTMQVASVGETVYSLALGFNADKIYLLGLDLALGDDGSSHSPDHFKAATITQSNKEDESYHLDKEIFEVKGNLRKTVNSTPLLAMSIPVINNKTKNLKTKNQTIYNMSDGAYFEETLALHPSQYQGAIPLDKTILHKQLQEFFDSYSTDTLNDAEMRLLELRQRFIDEMYEVLDAFAAKPYASRDIFYYHYLKLVNALAINDYTNELKELLNVFLLRITSFISDFYNTKDMKNMKKHNKKFKQILEKQMRKMTQAYEEELHKLTDKNLDVIEEVLEHSVE